MLGFCGELKMGLWIAYFLSLILISQICIGQEKELLEDLPPITPETIRWNMPVDIWLNGVPAYLMNIRLGHHSKHLKFII